MGDTYLIFLFFWIPKNTFYRMFYMPAIVVLIGILLTRYGIPERRKLLLPLFVTVMAAANFLFFIYPYSRVRRETPLDMALRLNQVWSGRSVIYYSNVESDNQLLRYFNPATTWRKIDEIDPVRLEAEIEKINSIGGDVWIETSALKRFAADEAKAKWLREHTVTQMRLADRAYDMTLVRVGR